MSQEKRINGFVGTNDSGLGYLKSSLVTEMRTIIGYLQVLEYQLQDSSYVHVVQYHFNHVLEENSNFPKMNCKSFYREKDKAFKFAHEIGCKLLEQYL